MRQTKKYKAFTFIELMIAITIMAIAFFPIMNLFSTAISDIAMTSEMSTALSLGREGIEMVRNMNLPVERLKQYDSYYYPPMGREPIKLNNNSWRIHTIIHKDSSPLRVDVEVITEPEKDVKMTLSTLFEDLY